MPYIALFGNPRIAPSRSHRIILFVDPIRASYVVIRQVMGDGLENDTWELGDGDGQDF
jgi:hypothetical protein